MALLGAVTGGCSTGTIAFRTGAVHPPPNAVGRLPDGVLAIRLAGPVLGAPSALSADGEVALRAPVPLERAREVVDALLRAHVDEDFDRVRELVLPDASTFNPTVGRTGSVSLLAAFRERVRRLDYRKLAGLPLTVTADMEVYTYDDLHRLPQGRPLVPPDMAKGDALVRARVQTPRVGPDRFFGDYVEVHLRPSVSDWQVVSVGEEMPLP